jgi:hypothetical protein
MTERWRLIGGEQLYDIRTDPGQQRNIAAGHEAVVSALRAEYEHWWSTLEPRFADYGWIILGSEKEQPTRLTCHDWHEAGSGIAYQANLTTAPELNGYWMVQVAQPGRYEFTLRQLPEEARQPIAGSRARLQLDAVDVSQPVRDGATAVSFVVELGAVKSRLQTWFTEDAGKARGAFFVEVRRLE